MTQPFPFFFFFPARSPNTKTTQTREHVMTSLNHILFFLVFVVKGQPFDISSPGSILDSLCLPCCLSKFDYVHKHFIYLAQIPSIIKSCCNPLTVVFPSIPLMFLCGDAFFFPLSRHSMTESKKNQNKTKKHLK